MRPMRKPESPRDIRDVQVIKHDRAFFVSDSLGEVPEDKQTALGLYFRDTRFLSRLELSVDDLPPILLHSSAERNYLQVAFLAFPLPTADPEAIAGEEYVGVSRRRVICGSLTEQIEVTNVGRAKRVVALTVDFDADFLDVLELRGWSRANTQPAQVLPPQASRNSVTLGSRGADGWVRTTTLRFSPAPETLTSTRAAFELTLEPGQASEITIEITPEVGSVRPTRLAYREAVLHLEQQYTQWRKRCTRFRTNNQQLARFLERATMDLRMLLSEAEHGESYIDAGLPWYGTLFGRDSILTAYECLGLNPDLSWTVLRTLAGLQGTGENAGEDEEPGKILHELRAGELAGAGEVPAASFASVDSTPLWLVLFTYAYAWTGDLAAVRSLWANALAALAWIDGYGDLDGDGYVEYQARGPGGVQNQGWKDSGGAIANPDGGEVHGPIALVEVQGYVYQAKSRMALLADELGALDLAERLRTDAALLKQRFNEDFWLEEEGTFALALDGDKRKVETVASNAGHTLWSGIADAEKAARVAKRMLSPRLSSGWGIRTLAAGQRPYDPLGYHTGSVWPHDNALIAHGLKRYGFDEDAGRAVEQLFAAGLYFPLGRFPELFCGFSREEAPVPVEHPLACRPQAWAVGAPLLMLRSFAGLTADAPNGALTLVRPELPVWLDRLEMIGMRVGQARVDLTLSNYDGVTAVQVARKEGDLDVVIRQ